MQSTISPVMARRTTTPTTEPKQSFSIVATFVAVLASIAYGLASMYETYFAPWAENLSDAGNSFRQLGASLKERVVSRIELSHTFTKAANHIGLAAQNVIGNPNAFAFDPAQKAKIVAKLTTSLMTTAEQLRQIPSQVSWDASKLEQAAVAFEAAAETLVSGEPNSREAFASHLNEACEAIRAQSIILASPEYSQYEVVTVRSIDGSQPYALGN